MGTVQSATALNRSLYIMFYTLVFLYIVPDIVFVMHTAGYMQLVGFILRLGK